MLRGRAEGQGRHQIHPEPKAVPKKIKEAPKPVRKPEPAIPKKSVPSPNGSVSGRTLKSLARLLKPLGISEIPTHQSSFYVVDPAHVAMIGVSSSDGMSLFGLEGGLDDSGVDIVELAGGCSASSLYRVHDEGSRLILDDGSKRIPADIRGGLVLPKRPNISMSSVYIVDPAAFDSEFGRVRGILNGGRRTNSSDRAIRLYGKDGDLMMSGRNPRGYGFRADVGDGDEGDGSFYCYSYLNVLADMFRLSDSQCTLSMGDDFPLEGSCSMDGLRLTMPIAPMREE